MRTMNIDATRAVLTLLDFALLVFFFVIFLSGLKR